MPKFEDQEEEDTFHRIKLIPNNFPFTAEDLDEIWNYNLTDGKKKS